MKQLNCKIYQGWDSSSNLFLYRRLENNRITEIGPHAFKTGPELKRMQVQAGVMTHFNIPLFFSDLSRNRLEKISPEAFTFNKMLTTM